MKTIHILNPAAGQGAAVNFKESESSYTTKSVGDATQFVRNTLENANEEINFCVHGGDGTVNEVVTGIMSAQSGIGGLSIVPSGTGNDLIRSLAETGADKIDVLTVNDGFAVNAVNTGFDLEVVLRAAEFKKKPFVSGTLAYILGVVSVFCQRFGKQIHIEYTDKDGNEHVFDDECLLAVAANGRYYGGGFKASPAADVTDGHIDLMIVKKISRLKFLALVAAYKSGKHIDAESVKVAKKFEGLVTFAKCKRVRFDKIDKLCCDGEVSPAKYAQIGIIPSALRTYSEKDTEILKI